MAATPYPAWDGFAPRLALPDGGCALSGLQRIAPRLRRYRMAAAPYPAWDGLAPRLALPDDGFALCGLGRDCTTPGVTGWRLRLIRPTADLYRV